MLNYEFPPLGGGASPVSYEIAKGYVKLGHQVTVVTMGFKGLPSFEKVDGINVYRIPCIRSKKEICYPHEMLSYVISARRFLWKHLKDHKYDVNHTHFIIPTGIVSLWVKRKFGIPYIITSHGSDVPGYNNDRFKLLHKFTNPTLKKIIKEAEKIVCPSRYLFNLIENNVISLDTKGLIIPNGIDVNKFKPQKKKKIILSTGRLLPRKGFQYLVQAVSNKDYRYEVHIAGNGPMMTELKELAKNSKTEVIFHGWMDNKSQEYKDLLESASIYCLVSERENASIALLEAMSAGCVVITSNVSGCPETIGNDGFLVAPGDVENMREILGELTSNPNKIRNFGNKSRKRVLDEYDWNKKISKYEKIFRGSLDEIGK